ncbi:MAG: UDP-glucose 4-epimerase, partial [bacterium]
NIGGGQRATVNEVIGYINELQETPLKVNREDVQKGDVRHTWADTTRAAADLGFRPRTDMREGLKAEREWLIRRTNE